MDITDDKLRRYFLNNLSDHVPVNQIIDDIIFREKVSCINNMRAFYTQVSDCALTTDAKVDFSDAQLDVINKLPDLINEAMILQSNLTNLINFNIDSVVFECSDSHNGAFNFIINAEKESCVELMSSFSQMLMNKLKLEFSEAILKIVESIEKFFAS